MIASTGQPGGRSRDWPSVSPVANRFTARRRLPSPVWPTQAALALVFFAVHAAGQQTIGQQTLTDSSGQRYRLIEANHFEMGARRPNDFRVDHSEYNAGDDDHPIHGVVLSKPFYMATTEVTVGQFKAFVDETSYRTTAETSKAGIVGWNPINDDRGQVKSSFACDPDYNWRQPGFPQDDTHPVVGVSFEDAKAYCDWLSKKEGVVYRLPTEAEWECACRAGTMSYFSFGDRYRETIHRHANIGNVELERHAPGRVLSQWLVDVSSDPEDGFVFTAPVGSYEPNPWGLYDLHGNVWEWCEDQYLDTFYKQFDRDGHQRLRKWAIDPVCRQRWNEQSDWRVIRGGSWFVSPIQCRSGVRGVFEQRDAACYVGFRIVREAPEGMIVAATQRFDESESALKTLRDSAGEIREEHDGHLKFVFRCEDCTQEQLQLLKKLDYRVELEIRPPGPLTAELIENVAEIKRLTGLKISVGGGQITSSDFAPLTRHPELRWLQITGNVDLDDGLLDHLVDAQSLNAIHLQGSKITDQGLAKLPKLKTLETFHVSATQSTGAVLKRFAGSPIREVSFTNLDDDGAEHLQLFESIVSVAARGCPIGQSGLDAITSRRHLRSLQLENCARLEDDDFQLLERLAHVDRIDLAGTNAGDRAAEAMRNLLHLRDLRIGSEHLTDAGLQTICEIVSLQALMVTDAASQITDAGLRDFWRLVNLRSLHLDVPGITGDGLAPLAELPELRQLTLKNFSLSDQSVKMIAAIPNLEELSIAADHDVIEQKLSDAGLIQLAEAESLKKLTLQNAGITVTDQGVEQLKQQRPRLRVSIR